MVNPDEYLSRKRPRITVSRPNKLGYGITERNRRKSFLVKFKQNKKTIYVGSYINLVEAQLAAKRYLRDLQNAHL